MCCRVSTCTPRTANELKATRKERHTHLERWYPGRLRSGATVDCMGAATPVMFPALAMSGPNTPAALVDLGGRASPNPNVRVQGWFGGRNDAVEVAAAAPLLGYTAFALEPADGGPGGIIGADEAADAGPMYSELGRDDDSAIDERVGVIVPHFSAVAGS